MENMKDSSIAETDRHKIANHIRVVRLGSRDLTRSGSGSEEEETVDYQLKENIINILYIDGDRG